MGFLKKLAVVTAIVLASSYALKAYKSGAIRNLSKNEKEIVIQLQSKSVSSTQIEKDIRNFSNILSNLESIKASINGEKYGKALDIIINTNGLLTKIESIDTREARSRLLDLRKDLTKVLKEKQILTED